MCVAGEDQIVIVPRWRVIEKKWLRSNSIKLSVLVNTDTFTHSSVINKFCANSATWGTDLFFCFSHGVSVTH